MSSDEFAIPKDVLCKALNDVANIAFDVDSESDVLAAELLLLKLSKTQGTAEQLAASIAKHIQSSGDHSTISESSFAKVTLMRSTTIFGSNDFLQDDFPSESTAELKARTNP